MTDSTEDKLTKEAEKAGVELLGSARNANYRLYRIKGCDHEQEIATSLVRNGSFRCRQCLDDKLVSEADRAGLQLLGAGQRKAYRR